MSKLIECNGKDLLFWKPYALWFYMCSQHTDFKVMQRKCMHCMEIFGTPNLSWLSMFVLHVNHTSSEKNINYWTLLLPVAEPVKIFPLFWIQSLTWHCWCRVSLTTLSCFLWHILCDNIKNEHLFFNKIHVWSAPRPPLLCDK